jgi:hypothetical protein
MSWLDELLQERSGLLPPAHPEALRTLACTLGVTFPQEYVDFLLHADGGLWVRNTILFYSVGPGLHPAETLLAANQNRGPGFPLFLIGRFADEEFGFLRKDLTHKEAPPASCPVYLYHHETETMEELAPSLAEFVRQHRPRK